MTQPEQSATHLEPGPVPASGPAGERPTSTYRLQLSRSFDLTTAARLAGYLKALGVGAVYLSPIFTAASGSASGYDVCDYNSLEPDLGGRDAFDTFCAAVRPEGLGVVVDFVPNHMGTDAERNLWWRDVLAHGPQSTLADYFDIDWAPPKHELRGRLLLPILAQPYGESLANGAIAIVRGATGEPVVRCPGHTLPLRPGTPIPAGTPGPDALHAMLEQQAYRLAYWRTSSDEVNYRRFFDVDHLAGVRMERSEVFAAAHRLLVELASAGGITGVRLDHVDGLANPRAYLAELREALGRAGQAPFLVVEKILVGDEALPDDWPGVGTTGYEALACLSGLFVSHSGWRRLTADYQRTTGILPDLRHHAVRARLEVMATTLASEIEMLAQRLNAISERQRTTRDFTLRSLRRALMEFIAALPVYRTYLRVDGESEGDLARVRQAADAAARRHPALEPSVFAFLASVLSGPAATVYTAADAADVEARARFTTRLQQVTGSVYAKGVEDTALYRCQPLLSVNEVGGRHEQPAVNAGAFHAFMQSAVASGRLGLVPTATHDTKLGADARARLHVLTEVPDDWRRLHRRWRQLMKPLRTRLVGEAQLPAAALDADEWRLQQAIAATWDLSAAGFLDEPPRDYVDRLVGYLLKASREAKVQTSWIHPHAGYEATLEAFARGMLTGRAAARVRRAGADLLMLIARAGAVNGLAQRLLAAGAPGVTDVYQGGELWDLSLVDPDNRRPVDFARCERWLGELMPRLTASGGEVVNCDDLLSDWASGRLMLYVTAAALRARRTQPSLFVSGAYVPLVVEGESTSDGPADVIAFARVEGTDAAIVVVPRFVATLMRSSQGWPIGEVWAGKTIRWPRDLPAGVWRNAFTGATLTTSSETISLPVSALLSALPVGLWTRPRQALPGSE